MSAPKPENIDAYIAAAPAEAQAYLRRIRALVRQTLPAAEETISYAIPCFRWQNTYLLYFAGYKKHVSIYPAPHEGGEAFQNELGPYRAGKGTLQFSVAKELPEALIVKIIEQRCAGAEALMLSKTEKKKK
ncbi:MAG: DUF1801 domain-containing protein [Bacteroidia bacterium]|nr:DUF1801 domain-containing protein [Bacteroidia bacterium]